MIPHVPGKLSAYRECLRVEHTTKKSPHRFLRKITYLRNSLWGNSMGEEFFFTIFWEYIE